MGKLNVELLLLDSFSNFGEFSALQRDPGLALSWRKPGSGPAGVPDLLIIPGSKRTLEDLKTLNSSGESRRLASLARKGVWMLGICGGLQMLGNAITDEAGVDGVKRARVRGLGLLPSLTRMHATKITAQSRCAAETEFGRFTLSGYEIHHGRTLLEPGSAECALGALPGRPMLIRNPSGRIWGSYLHGLLDNAPFRGAFLARVAKARRKPYAAPRRLEGSRQDKEIQRFADHVASHLRLNLIPGFPK